MTKSAQPWVLTLLRTVFDQPDKASVHAQFDRVVDGLAEKFLAAAETPRRSAGGSVGVRGVPA